MSTSYTIEELRQAMRETGNSSLATTFLDKLIAQADENRIERGSVPEFTEEHTGRGQWIPRRQWSVAHWRFYRSPNGKVTISLGGDFCTWAVQLGKLGVQWDAE